MLRSTIAFYTAALLSIMLVPIESVADTAPRDVTWAELAPGGRDQREYIRNASPLASIFLGLNGDKLRKPEMARDLDGKQIRLSGYIVPLKFLDGGVKAFLLVPYVGACIHVPPPPKNQIVLVTSPRPIGARGLFEAVTVTGMLSVADSQAGSAQTGYRLTASDVSRYKEYRRIKQMQGDHDALTVRD